MMYKISTKYVYDDDDDDTRNLQILDVEARSYGPVLVSVIMNKLPPDFKLDITRKMPAGKWSIENLMKTLKRYLNLGKWRTLVFLKQKHSTANHL